MKRIAFWLGAVVTLAGVAAFTDLASRADGEASPTFVTQIPSGYRDWRLISVAHEEGNLNSFAAVLGNDVAIKAYRERKLQFPDGTIIAALHYSYAPSDENNKVFGRAQSFVASTGGWGVRSFQGRQARRRGVYEYVLPLPQSDQR